MGKVHRNSAHRNQKTESNIRFQESLRYLHSRCIRLPWQFSSRRRFQVETDKTKLPCVVGLVFGAVQRYKCQLFTIPAPMGALFWSKGGSSQESSAGAISVINSSFASLSERWSIFHNTALKNNGRRNGLMSRMLFSCTKLWWTKLLY